MNNTLRYVRNFAFLNLLLAFGVFAQATAQPEVLWERVARTGATEAIPSWFANGTERGIAFGYMGDDPVVYVASRNGNEIKVLNADTGADVTLLTPFDLSSLSGGTFVLNDINVTSDGKVIVTNLSTDNRVSPFKIYVFNADGGAPINSFSFTDADAPSAYRLGDKTSVVGSWADGTIEVWAAVASTNPGQINVFKTTDQGANWTSSYTTLSGSLVAVPSSPNASPISAGGSVFYVNGNGGNIKVYNAAGEYQGAAIGGTGSMNGVKAFVVGDNTYAAAYLYRELDADAVKVGYVTVWNVTDPENPVVVGSSPKMAESDNGNHINGDVAVRVRDDGTWVVYGLGANQGIQAFGLPAAPAPTLFVENFDYGVGALLTENGWTAHSAGGTNPITVVDQALTFAGYASSGLGRAVAMSTSEDINRSIGFSVTENSFYASFMVNVSAVNTSGDYFFHFSTDPQGSFYGRTFVKSNADGKLAFGLQKTSGTGTSSTFTGFDYDLDTTYLIVVRYTFITDGDDETALVVNPVGSAEPSTWDVVNTPGADIASIGTVALRQASGNAPTLVLGGLRAGTSYAEVVGDPEEIVPPPPPAEFVAHLSGVNEVPFNLSAGTGTVTASLSGDQLTVSGSFADLTGDYSMSHIHGPAAPGLNAGVVVGLTAVVGGDSKSGTYSTEDNTFTLTESQIIMLQEGALYINVHSSEYPGGEIRGQLLPSPNDTAPTASAITAPADAADVNLDGGLKVSPFTATWSAATDAESNAVAYIWQLSTASDFSTLALVEPVGRNTSITLTYEAVDNLLEGAGVLAGGTATLYHRVVTTDGSKFTVGDAASVNVTRGTLKDFFTISEALAQPNNTTVVVRGIVTRGFGRESRIQDETGAMGTFASSGAYFDGLADGSVRMGDLVELTGSRGAFNNLDQISSITAHEVLSRDNPLPAAELVTLADIRDNGESLKSKLIRVEGITINAAGDETFSAGSGSGKTYRITDATVTEEAVVDFRVPNQLNTKIVGQPIPASAFDFEGVLGVFNTTFQLYPVEATDVTVPVVPLVGEYYIPQGANLQGFASLKEAADALNYHGAEGPVMLIIDDDLDETGHVVTFNRQDLTEETPVIVMPASGKSPVVLVQYIHLFATSNLFIIGNDQLTDLIIEDIAEVQKAAKRYQISEEEEEEFDLFDFDFGPRNLTFQLTVTPPASRTFFVEGLHFNSVVASVNVTRADSVGAAAAGFLVNRRDAAGVGQGAANDFAIVNVGIGSTEAPFKDGMQLWGSATGAFPHQYLFIFGNDIHAGHRGITTQIHANSMFIKNKIWIHGYNDGTHSGINVNTPIGELGIMNNEILQLATNRAATTSMRGINLTNSLNETVVIANNMINAWYSNSEVSTDHSVYGIAHAGSASLAEFVVFHNTIRLTNTNQTGVHTALGAVGGSTGAPFTFVNNIVVNDKAGGSGIEWTGSNLTSESNNLFAPVVARLDGEEYTTLDDWTTTGNDNRSVVKEVTFVSDTDLRLSGTSLGDADLAGLQVYFPFDIDFNVRNLVAPYMGAFEGPALQIPLGNFALISPSNGSSVVIDAGNLGTEVNIFWEEPVSSLAWSRTNAVLLNDAFAHGGSGTNAAGGYVGTNLDSEGSITTPLINDAATVSFWAATYNNNTELTVSVEASLEGFFFMPVGELQAVSGGTGDININWQEFSFELETEVPVYIRFNVLGETVSGAAYFDDLTVQNMDGDVVFSEDFEDWDQFQSVRYTWYYEPANNTAEWRVISVPSDNDGESPYLTLTLGDIDNALRDILVPAGATFNGVWTVKAEIGDEMRYASTPFALQVTRAAATSVVDEELPLVFALDQNYPNPFNPSTTIKYSLPNESRVELRVYTVTGQLVGTLVNEVKPAGHHYVNFDASRLASGVYIYRIVAGDFTQTHKMTLVK